MIVDPAPVVGHVLRRPRLVKVSVYVEANGVLLPFDGEHVKSVRELLPVWQRIGRPEWVASGVAGAVEAAVHDRRLSPDVLHHVDFAAGRPTHVADVAAEHPESRPDTLSLWHLQTRLDAPVG